MTQFTDAGIDRYEFAHLSAVTPDGVLGLPAEATATLASGKMTDRYQYLVNHTPRDYRVPTVVTFAVRTGFNALDGLGIDYETGEGSRPTARTALTTPEVADVLDVAVASHLAYDPDDDRERPVRGTRRGRSPVRRRNHSSRQSGQRPSSR